MVSALRYRCLFLDVNSTVFTIAACIILALSEQLNDKVEQEITKLRTNWSFKKLQRMTFLLFNVKNKTHCNSMCQKSKIQNDLRDQVSTPDDNEIKILLQSLSWRSNLTKQ